MWTQFQGLSCILAISLLAIGHFGNQYFGNQYFGNQHFGNCPFGNQYFGNCPIGNQYLGNWTFDNQYFGNQWSFAMVNSYCFEKLMVNLFWFTMLSKTISPIAFLPLTLLVLLSLVFWLFAYLHCLSKQKAQFSKTWFLKIAWPRSNFCHALDF